MTKATDTSPQARTDVRAALLDAAERLLIEDGAEGMTTRRIASEAGVNHGLVHYYFGSVGNLVVATFERFTDRLIARQREMYARESPFIEKWRTAMGYMEVDLASGYPKIWAELQAMAYNHPELRESFARVTGEWRAVLREAFAEAAREYDLSPKLVEPFVTLVMNFSQGMFNERLVGIDEGHKELLAWFDGVLVSFEQGRA
jgi:AcrR family transcriptional regulator